MASYFPLLCPSQFINQFEEEVPILRAKVKQLQVQTQEPREIVFADVLLRKPKYVIFLQLLLKLDGNHCSCYLYGKNNMCHLLSTYYLLAGFRLIL